jgi:hypothetical protein
MTFRNKMQEPFCAFNLGVNCQKFVLKMPPLHKSVSLLREPDAVNQPVRFDEREQEPGSCQTGLRGRGESQVTYPPGDYRHCACSRLFSP